MWIYAILFVVLYHWKHVFQVRISHINILKFFFNKCGPFVDLCPMVNGERYMRWRGIKLLSSWTLAKIIQRKVGRRNLMNIQNHDFVGYMVQLSTQMQIIKRELLYLKCLKFQPVEYLWIVDFASGFCLLNLSLSACIYIVRHMMYVCMYMYLYVLSCCFPSHKISLLFKCCLQKIRKLSYVVTDFEIIFSSSTLWYDLKQKPSDFILLSRYKILCKHVNKSMTFCSSSDKEIFIFSNFLAVNDIEHDPDAQVQDCYIAMEALCEV